MMNFKGALLEAGISCIVQKLGDFAVGRSQQFVEIADDINWIKEELSMMKASLKDAERRMETNEAFNEWVKQVKNAAFMMEDFMDEYFYAEQRFQAGGSSRSSSDKVETSDGQMVQKVKNIKNKDTDISRRSQTYGIHLMPSFGLGFNIQDKDESSRAIYHRPVHSSPFEEVDIVGFNEDASKLMDWLYTEEEMTLSIMSIVEIGGSGKTTLAKKVYSIVENHFDHNFWVTASQYYPSQLSDFLKDIEECLNYSGKGRQSRTVTQKCLEELKIQKQLKRQKQKDVKEELTLALRHLKPLMRHVQQSLKILLDEKRCILLESFWKALEGGLPGKGRGNIIFTSREKITNSLVNGNCHVHMLNPLPFELAWDLFCRNAFKNYTPLGSSPNYLNELGTAIVRRCGGLPLALVLMGCLMSNKGNSPKEWKDMVNHFNLGLLHNPGLESLNWVLQASYNHLPSQLKYCFLYCCLFPKHHRIKRKKITKLWEAQRFVEKQQGKLLEDVAYDYFIQLIEMSFLQPIISEFTWEIIECKVHEIMHNFAISKFSEEFGILATKPCNECEQKRLLALQNCRIPCERQVGNIVKLALSLL